MRSASWSSASTPETDRHDLAGRGVEQRDGRQRRAVEAERRGAPVVGDGLRPAFERLPGHGHRQHVQAVAQRECAQQRPEHLHSAQSDRPR